MRVLAIGAHPDDLEISAWGTLCAWKDAGAALILATATDGQRGGTDDDLAKTRAGEARAAAATLGVAPVLLGFPDGDLHADRALDAVLRALIDDVGPDLLVTHAPEDYHADHRALANACLQAANFTVPVLHMDVLGGTGFVPTHWVEITAHAAAKRAAILLHASQDPARFVALAERQNAFRAGECNAPPEARAEAFRFAPRFPFADIRALLPPAPPVRAIGRRDV